MDKIESKFGYVSVIGATNVGKSTLLNNLIGQKISIVTRKKQTTRNKIIGIFCEKKSQVVIIDTPGIFQPKRKLDRAMVAAAWSTINDADLIIIMLEANKTIESNTLILKHLKESRSIDKKKLICVINKIDLVRKDKLLYFMNEARALINSEEFFLISALNGDGVKDLKSHLSNNIPLGVWLYPKDQITDIPYRLLASEIVREKLMNVLHQELPYELAVETESWNELDDNSIRIDMLVYVNKLGQKKILIGSNGSNIKKIGTMARKEIKDMLGKNVHLFIYVKVQNNWDNNPNYFKTLGLKYNV